MATKDDLIRVIDCVLESDENADCELVGEYEYNEADIRVIIEELSRHCCEGKCTRKRALPICPEP